MFPLSFDDTNLKVCYNYFIMSWLTKIKNFMNEEETKVVDETTPVEEVVAPEPEVVEEKDFVPEDEEVVLKNPVVIDGAVVSDPTKVGVNTADMQN